MISGSRACSISIWLTHSTITSQPSQHYAEALAAAPTDPDLVAARVEPGMREPGIYAGLLHVKSCLSWTLKIVISMMGNDGHRSGGTRRNGNRRQNATGRGRYSAGVRFHSGGVQPRQVAAHGRPQNDQPPGGAPLPPKEGVLLDRVALVLALLVGAARGGSRHPGSQPAPPPAPPVARVRRP
jgi:hypothetical protein